MVHQQQKVSRVRAAEGVCKIGPIWKTIQTIENSEGNTTQALETENQRQFTITCGWLATYIYIYIYIYICFIYIYISIDICIYYTVQLIYKYTWIYIYTYVYIYIYVYMYICKYYTVQANNKFE